MVHSWWFVARDFNHEPLTNRGREGSTSRSEAFKSGNLPDLETQELVSVRALPNRNWAFEGEVRVYCRKMIPSFLLGGWDFLFSGER